MPRSWGKTDYKELAKFQKRLQKITEDEAASFCSKMAKELALRLLRKVKQKTPVGVKPEYATQQALEDYWEGYEGGELRKNWKVTEVTDTNGGKTFEVEIFNPLEYASYVEYGHRQQVGRYVPQLGLALTNGWVEGKHMLKLSEEEIQKMAPRFLEKRLQQEIMRLLNDA